MVVSTRMMIPTKITWKIIMLESSCWTKNTWNIHYKDFSTDDVVENPFHPCKFHAFGPAKLQKFLPTPFQTVPTCWVRALKNHHWRVGDLFQTGGNSPNEDWRDFPVKFRDSPKFSGTKNSPGYFLGDLPLPNKTGAQNMDLKFSHALFEVPG